MKIGFIGLGKMGLNMSLRLIEKGHDIIGYARKSETRSKAKSVGVATTDTIEKLIKELAAPRVIWLMVPSGSATDEVLSSISPLLDKGDIIIDGGNSYYKDSISRGKEMKDKAVADLSAVLELTEAQVVKLKPILEESYIQLGEIFSGLAKEGNKSWDGFKQKYEQLSKDLKEKLL